MSVLEVQGLTKSYGTNRVVDDISFSLAEGECLALLGPSGCGKTTLLNIVAGFIEPDGGEVLMEGRRLTAAPPHRRNMGMVFQDYALFPHLNVFQNVEFGLKMRGTPQKSRREIAAQVLQLVGLSELGERNVAQLSGGQRQRVAVARALAIRPKLLLFDEPLSNLDTRLRESMRAEIRDLLTRTRLTAVFVTHDQSEAFAVADRIAVLNKGRIEQIGPPGTIYARPQTQYAAECLGACNLIEGVVTAVDGETASINALQTTVWARVGICRPAIGDCVQLVVRPHEVRLAERNGAGSEGIDGRVSHVEKLSTHTHVIVRCEGERALVVVVPSRTAVSVGDTVKLEWEIDATWILPARAAR